VALLCQGWGAPESSHGRHLYCSLFGRDDAAAASERDQMVVGGCGWALCRHRHHAQAGPWSIRQRATGGWVALRINPPTKNVGSWSIEKLREQGIRQANPTTRGPSSTVLLTPGKSKYHVLVVRCRVLTRPIMLRAPDGARPFGGFCRLYWLCWLLAQQWRAADETGTQGEPWQSIERVTESGELARRVVFAACTRFQRLGDARRWGWRGFVLGGGV
jgi:hypothetical protein